MHISDRPDDSRLDPLVDETGSVAGVALVSHLSHDLRIGERQISQRPRFVHRVGQRLLHVDVLAALHRSFGHDGVQMIRSCDDDTIDVLLLVQHLAEIGVARGLVEFLFEGDAFGPVALLIVLELLGDLALRKSEIDVREGDEILRLGQLQSVLGSHATNADYREVHGVAGRLVSDAAKHVSRNDHNSNSDLSGIGNELASRDLLTRHEKQPPV